MPAANNDLFNIDKITHGDGSILAVIGINPGSEILKGHFPGHPVVPGANMLQAVKDILEKTFGAPMQLKRAGHLKFMSLIDPENIAEVQIEISYRFEDDRNLNISAKLTNGDMVCFKMQGVFITA